MPIFSQFGEIMWQRLFNMVRILQTSLLMLMEIFHDSFENFKITRIFVWKKKFSGYLILICSLSLCWQIFQKWTVFMFTESWSRDQVMQRAYWNWTVISMYSSSLKNIRPLLLRFKPDRGITKSILLIQRDSSKWPGIL